MAWVSIEQVRDQWSDAAMLSDEVLQAMLDATHEQCAAYAPSLGEGAPVPPNFTQAEIMQVRDLYAAANRDGDVLGFGDGFAVRVRPLGESVKALLRPRRAVPKVR